MNLSILEEPELEFGGEAVMLISASVSRTMARSTFRLPRLRRKFALA